MLLETWPVNPSKGAGRVPTALRRQQVSPLLVPGSSFGIQNLVLLRAPLSTPTLHPHFWTSSKVDFLRVWIGPAWHSLSWDEITNLACLLSEKQILLQGFHLEKGQGFWNTGRPLPSSCELLPEYSLCLLCIQLGFNKDYLAEILCYK